MVKRRALLALLPLLLLAGCKQPEKFSTSSGVSVENPAADALASAQLGELDGLLSRRSWPTCIPLWNSSSPCAKPGRGKSVAVVH